MYGVLSMNICSLCNPDSVHKRDEAYRLLGSGCSLASVAERLKISYPVLQRCWSEHDTDPLRNVGRRLVKAKRRLAKAEAHHKKLKTPDVQSRLELDSALKNVNDLERLAEQVARDFPTDGKSSLIGDEAGRMADYLDSIIEEGGRTKYACHEVKLLGLGVQMEHNPELLPIFKKIADDPALLATIQNLMRGAA
jgi:hypothetical protein